MNRLVLASLAIVSLAGLTAGCSAGDHAAGSTVQATTGPATTAPVASTGGHTFGATGYDGVRLGMSPAQARRAGATVTRLDGESCSGVLLPDAKRAPHQVDGWLSRRHGVVLITTTDRSAATPEGLRVGMTPAQVRAVYPTARHNPDFWSVAVPGHPGESYWWGYQRGAVGALTIVLDSQDCVN